MEIRRGYIQLYTGNGKGKTTAAIGLSIRAAGAGLMVFIAQFVKGMHYSELDILKKVPLIEVKQYGRDCFIKHRPDENDIIAARLGLKEVADIIFENKTDILILDEVCVALHYHLFEMYELKRLLDRKPESMEIILTGRYAPDELTKMCDLVTDMTEIKHYYQNGIQAREGIEY